MLDDTHYSLYARVRGEDDRLVTIHVLQDVLDENVAEEARAIGRDGVWTKDNSRYYPPHRVMSVRVKKQVKV